MATANRTINIKPISVNVLTAQEKAAERLKYLQSQNLYATDSPIPSYDGAEERSDMYAGKSFFPTASAADLDTQLPDGALSMEEFRKLQKKGTEEITTSNELSMEEFRKLQGRPPSNEVDAFTALAQGVGTGTANVLGGTIDAINAGLGIFGLNSENPFGGSTNIKRGFNRAFGPKTTYENIKEIPEIMRPVAQAGEVIGGAGFFGAIPFAVSSKLSQIPAVFRPIVETARQKPTQFATVEAASTLGAAGGAAVAEKLAPENSIASLLAQIAGGTLSPLVAASKVAGRTVDVVSNFVRQFYPAGKEKMAGTIIKKALINAGEDPDKIIRQLKQRNELPEINLTSAQQTDSSMLLAMEKMLRQKKDTDSGVAFSRSIEKQDEENIDILQTFITELEKSGDPALLKIAAKLEKNLYTSAVKKDMQIAQQRAEQARNALIAQGKTKTEASIAANEILEKAEKTARQKETALWTNLGEDLITLETGKKWAIDEARETIKNRMVPEESRKFKLSTENFKNIDAFIERIKKNKTVTTKDLRIFRSNMLEAARQESGSIPKNRTRASMWNQLATAALEDLNKFTSRDARKNNAFETARVYSRELNEVFTQTSAGNVLALKNTGADRILPEMVLERSFGSGGTQAKSNLNQLQKAAKFGGQNMIREQENFMRDYVVGRNFDPLTGKANPRTIAEFLRKNAELLQDFPMFKKDLGKTLSTEQKAKIVATKEKEAFKNISNETFEKILENESLTKTIKQTLESNKPIHNYKELIDFSKRAPSGAVDALKASTINYVKESASNAQGMSFSKFKDFLYKPISVNQPSLLVLMEKNKIISKEEIKNLKYIIEYGERIQRTTTTELNELNFLGATAAMQDFVLRVAGANAASQSPISQKVGSGLIVASAGSKLFRNLFDKLPKAKIVNVMMEAAKNPKFMALLIQKANNVKQEKEIYTKLRAYMLQSGFIDEEKTEEKRDNTNNAKQNNASLVKALQNYKNNNMSTMLF